MPQFRTKPVQFEATLRGGFWYLAVPDSDYLVLAKSEFHALFEPAPYPEFNPTPQMDDELIMFPAESEPDGPPAEETAIEYCIEDYEADQRHNQHDGVPITAELVCAPDLTEPSPPRDPRPATATRRPLGGDLMIPLPLTDEEIEQLAVECQVETWEVHDHLEAMLTIWPGLGNYPSSCISAATRAAVFLQIAVNVGPGDAALLITSACRKNGLRP